MTEDNGQGIIQGVFEIGNRFWARKNRRPNFDKLTKTKIFTKPLIINTEPVINFFHVYKALETSILVCIYCYH